MWPVARVAAATVAFAAAAAVNQFAAVRLAQEKVALTAGFTPLIAQARGGAARSARPELYAPGARLGFRVVGEVPDGLARNVLYAVRTGLAPAVVTPDPAAEPAVLFFPTPADADRFEAAGRGELLDRLGPHLAVYRLPRT